MAVIHVIAAMADSVICEHRFCDLAESPLGDAVVSWNGQLSVPDSPGLGFDIDLKVIEKYRIQ
jgi:L-alanine-DL-glutamate epimerase-like enolase superfamily enzyme